MTRSMYRRESAFMRFVSAFVALAFTLSIAGSGFAVPVVTPASDAAAPGTVATQPAPDAGAPAAPDPSVAPAPVPDPSVEVQPVTTEPGTAGGLTGAGQIKATPAKQASSSVKSVKGVAAAKTLTGAAIQPAASVGDISIVDFQGYNLGQGKWTNGNLGKEYNEGDWVPYRLVLKNTGGSAVGVAPIKIGLDHFDSNPNPAVMFDQSRMWGYSIQGTPPTTGDSKNAPAGHVGLTPAAQDVPEGGAFGAAETIATSFGADAFTIPSGQYAVLYFQGHLAMTVVWNIIQPGTDGAGGYPGSSGHGYLQMSGGARTLPLPSVTIPGGSVKAVKFYDTDHDGVKDPGETQYLSGWKMHLTNGPSGYHFDVAVTTDANGEALFANMPAGSYTITEELQSGWATKSGPQPVTITAGGSGTVYIGNYRPDVTKTWSLSIDALPVGGQPFVTFKVNGGELQSADLLGDGPYTAETVVPYGATISDITWHMSYGDEDVILGTSGNETLTADKTNNFTYDSSVAGVKFEDLNGDAVRQQGEPGLSGWNIVLKRVTTGGEVTYAQTFTGAGGAYSFADVIPGTYKVYEVQQDEWFNTLAPTGSFTVSNGSAISGKDFGNIHVLSSLTVEKSGVQYAHVGDTIPYTIVVTNSGNYMLHDVLVTDTRLGLSETIDFLAAGESVTYNLTYTVKANDPDPLPNTATAVGYDVFGNLVPEANDDHSVDIIKPLISVVKTADPTMSTNPADVTYTYVVTNTGEDTLTDVVLTDDMLTVPGGSIGTLGAGESVTLTASSLLDVTTTNVATVEGTDILGLTVSDTDDAIVEVFNPSISIVKSADPTVILEGEQVLYTYLVTNTGDITLHNVMVMDNVLGMIGTVAVMAPQATATLTIQVPVDADVTNIGTATGEYGTPDTDFFGTVTDSSEAVVDVVHPDIEVVKNASPSPVVNGTEVTYTYSVTNTGDVTLYDVSVVDDQLGAIGTIPVLLVDQTVELTDSAVLTETTTNVVTVTGHDDYDHTVTDTDEETVPVYNPKITIEKTPSSDTVLSGEIVTYTYVVTNTGDIALDNVAVTDDILGSIGVIGSLAVGESATLTKDAAVLSDTTNVGTATGTYGEADTDFFGTVTDDDDAFVNVIAPAVHIDKSGAPNPVIAGTEVTYTFVVTNSGDVPLYNLEVTDDVMGPIGTIDFLDVGDSVTLTKASTLNETTTNIATVTGMDAMEHPVTDTDDETVWVYNPSISIVKTADPTVILSGENVSYTYVVTNTGDITLTNIVVTDDIMGPIGIIPMLEPGDSTTLMGAYAPLVDTTNVATAVGTYGAVGTDFGGTVSDTDDAFVDVVSPDIAVTKSASADMVLAGDLVTYFYTVTNTGDVPLFNVLVTDDQLGVIGTIDELLPGVPVDFEASTNLDVTTTNVVTATGTDEYGHEVTDSAEALVEVFSPSISIVKTADPTVILSGETVTYTYLVTNTGDIELHDIAVTDDVLGDIGTIASLAPGESDTVTWSGPVDADVTNIGTAVGTYGNPDGEGFGGTVEDSDDATVDVINPAISVVKTPSATFVISGESVTYTYVVTNTGDVTLYNVKLVDDKLGTVGTLDSLAPLASETFTSSTPLSVPTTNVVTATGMDAMEHEVSDTDDAFVDVAPPFTDTQIIKSVDKTTVKPGDIVTYTLKVSLTAGSSVATMTITDDYDEKYMTPVDVNGGAVADGKIVWTYDTPLNAGEVRTVTYTMKVSDSAADGQKIKNIAVVNPFGDTDTKTIEVSSPFLPFTGGEWTLLALLALLALAGGLILRRVGRVTS